MCWELSMMLIRLTNGDLAELMEMRPKERRRGLVNAFPEGDDDRRIFWS